MGTIPWLMHGTAADYCRCKAKSWETALQLLVDPKDDKGDASLDGLGFREMLLRRKEQREESLLAERG